MDPRKTATIFVGYQNDYFAKDGILRGVVEEPTRVDEVLQNTLNFIRAVQHTPMTLISTPIVLAPDYRAMAHPVGILNSMKEFGAFKQGSQGAETIPEFLAFGDRITYVSGKVGFNAFAGTSLEETLKMRDIRTVFVCGVVTSLCIDSTGRAAYERGLDVSILSDCTSGRTAAEHEFYCANIFPLYGQARDSTQIIAELKSAAA
jgi:nicotinamidase-related amidase